MLQNLGGEGADAMTKVFIDGGSGTTGLRLAERLRGRKDLEMITLSAERHRDPAARAEALNAADIAFLCLPDDAAREAVGMVQSGKVAVIDTSTAHRVDPAWCYGMPELPGKREKIQKARRVANPGCHASGVIALLVPLLAGGILRPEAELTCTSLTGYSGGGKKMLAEYEGAEASPLLSGGRLYALTQGHKHLPEIMAACAGLKKTPVFNPIVTPCFAGMEVIIGLHRDQLNGTQAQVEEAYADFYRESRMIRFVPGAGEAGFLSSRALEGRDDMEISVAGNGERMNVIARFDNLGKGASGAAIQNMNLLMGVDETTGLALPRQ